MHRVVTLGLILGTLKLLSAHFTHDEIADVNFTVYAKLQCRF